LEPTSAITDPAMSSLERLVLIRDRARRIQEVRRELEAVK